MAWAWAGHCKRDESGENSVERKREGRKTNSSAGGLATSEVENVHASANVGDTETEERDLHTTDDGGTGASCKEGRSASRRFCSRKRQETYSLDRERWRRDQG